MAARIADSWAGPRLQADWPRAIDGSYVVTMLELVHALARREQAPAAVRSGQRLEIAISPDRYAPEGMFRSPLHPDEPAQPARVEDASGGDVDAPLVLAGPRATQLGTWWVDLSDRQAGAIERPLCVNLPVGESDLAAATGGELSSGLGETPHEYVPAGAEFVTLPPVQKVVGPLGVMGPPSVG